MPIRTLPPIHDGGSGSGSGSGRYSSSGSNSVACVMGCSGMQATEFDPEDEYRPEPEPEPLPPSWMGGSVRIGIHTSIAGSYLNALEAARKLGCNAVQIFSASPRMWQGRPARIPEGHAAAVPTTSGELRLGPL